MGEHIVRKAALGGREGTAGRPRQIDAAEHAAAVQIERQQLPRSQLLLHGERRNDRNTQSALHRGLHVLRRVDFRHGVQAVGGDAAAAEVAKEKKQAGGADWIFLIGLSLIVSAISQYVGASLNGALRDVGLAMFDKGSMTTLFVTVLGLVCAMTPLGKVPAVEELSSVYLYAVVSLLASTASVTDLLAAPMWVVYGFFILAVHVILMFFLSKLFHWDLCMVSTASLANIGGAASAPIVASAYDASYAGIGVLMGVLGAAVGNFAGMICGAILKMM